MFNVYRPSGSKVRKGFRTVKTATRYVTSKAIIVEVCVNASSDFAMDLVTPNGDVWGIKEKQ